MKVLEHFKGMTVLITGASSGFGAQFARSLAPVAGKLILVARRLDRLESLRESLIQAHPHLVVANFQVDLSDPSQREEFCRNIATAPEPIDFLINNAGLGDLGKFQSADWNRIHSILEVNISALTLVTHAVLPAMRKRKKGAILNVSSLSSIFPIPTLAVYAASKAYVGSFSESLRIELRNSGVTVTSVCPGPVETEFGAVASRKNGKDFPVPKWIQVTQEKVVDDALWAVARNRTRIFPGTAVQLCALGISLTPLWLLRRLLALQVR